MGQFPGNLKRVVEALRELGFSEVLEVASGADVTTKREAAEFVERMKHGERFMTTSCCPGYVEAVRLHLPEMAPFVSSTSTPMHYCAEIAKERFPGTTTVFIGPCVAKRREALYDPIVDYVLTFEEVGALLEPKTSTYPPARNTRSVMAHRAMAGDMPFPAVSPPRSRRRSETTSKSLPCMSTDFPSPGYANSRATQPRTVPATSLKSWPVKGGCVGGAGVIGDKIKVTKAVESFAKSGM